MSFFRKFAQNLVAHIDRRAGRKRRPQLLLQFLEFIIETVIFIIAHDLLVFLLICAPGTVQEIHQFTHMFHFVIRLCLHTVYHFVFHILYLPFLPYFSYLIF